MDLRKLLTLSVSLLFHFQSWSQPFDNAGWISNFPANLNGQINDVIETEDGIYVIGDFDYINGVPLNNIAFLSYEEDEWVSLGEGLDDRGNVLLLDGNDLYAGGSFVVNNLEEAKGLAVYDISTGEWSDTGTGLGDNSDVRSILLEGDMLYAAGQFTETDGAVGDNIAVYDLVMEEWSALGDGLQGFRVNAMTKNGDDIYVVGNFDESGEVSFNNVAKYDISEDSWEDVAGGTEGSVNSLLLKDNLLYAGGSSGITVYDITMGSWSTLTSDGFIETIVNDGEELFIGGLFSEIGGTVANNIVRYDISTDNWSKLKKGVDEKVNAIYPLTGQIVVGGSFSSADGEPVNGLARFNTDESIWSAIWPFSGFNSQIWTAERYDNIIYLGGSFTTLGDGTISPYIGAYDMDSEEWMSFGEANGTVRVIKRIGEKFYIGGQFTSIGGIEASRIAIYDPSNDSWESLGTGLNNIVFDIEKKGSDIYVCGQFSEAGGVAASNIARYNLNTDTWEDIGGTVGLALSLARSNTHLYAGGFLEEVGGVEVLFLGKFEFETEEWSRVSDNTGGGIIQAMTIDDEYLYVGGNVQLESGNSLINKLDLDTEEWSPLGTGVDRSVTSIEISGDLLFAGGSFTTAGESSANSIAAFDLNEEEWYAIGDGLDLLARDIVFSDHGFFAVGTFTEAGGTESGFFSQYVFDDDDDGVLDNEDTCLGFDDTIDEDGDGVPAGCDCDDEDADLNPETVWYVDEDGDGFGSDAETLTQCEQPDGFVLNDEDCVDDNPDINPDAEEVADGLDNNCNDEIDEGLTTSIEPLTVSTSSIYPNPFNHSITIGIPKDEVAINLEIYSITGTKYWSGNDLRASFTLNTSKWSPGIYLVRYTGAIQQEYRILKAQ